MAQNSLVIRGDGIGPRIMGATLQILKGAGARLDMEGLGPVKTEYLLNYDGKPEYSLSQGKGQ